MSIFAVKMLLEKDGFEETKTIILYFNLFKRSKNAATASFLIKKVDFYFFSFSLLSRILILL